MTTKEATRWAALEALCEEWKIPFELVDSVPLKDIKTTDDYAQIRQSNHRAPKENVDSYALQMSNGAVFPPVVLMFNDRSIVDGNTRLAAARRAGRNDFPAYLVKPVDAAMARSLGAAMNQLGGQRLVSAELEKAAKDLLDSGFPDAEIGRRLGRTPEWARKFRKESTFTARAGSHPGATSMPATVKQRLADIHLDAPFQRILEAAKEIRIDKPIAERLVKAVDEARSEGAMLEAVESEVARIRPLQQGVANGKPKETKSRVRLTTIKKVNEFVAWLEKVETPLVDPNAAELFEAISHLVEVAQAVAVRLHVSDAT